MRLSSALPLVAAVVGQYCPGGNTLPGDSNLGGVRLEQINDDSDCPGSTGVVDSTDQVANLDLNTQYTLRYNATTCGTLVYPRVTKAWIDFDDKGYFDYSEALGPVQTVPMQVDPQEITYTFTVPANAAATGRLRIVVVEGGGDPDPCTAFSYGGAKDFTVSTKKGPNYRCVAGECVPRPWGVPLGACQEACVAELYKCVKGKCVVATDGGGVPHTTCKSVCLPSSAAYQRAALVGAASAFASVFFGLT